MRNKVIKILVTIAALVLGLVIGQVFLADNTGAVESSSTTKYYSVEMDALSFHVDVEFDTGLTPDEFYRVAVSSLDEGVEEILGDLYIHEYEDHSTIVVELDHDMEIRTATSDSIEGEVNFPEVQLRLVDCMEDFSMNVPITGAVHRGVVYIKRFE